MLAVVPFLSLCKFPIHWDEARCAGHRQGLGIPGKHMPRSFYPPFSLLSISLTRLPSETWVNGLWLLAPVMSGTNLTMGLYSFLWPPRFPRIAVEWGVLC